MQKRTISLLLSLCLALTALCAAGCQKSNSDYPVTVGNLTFDSEPKNVVVLSDCVADIIEYMGYEVKFVGRSDEVSQESLSIVPTVGSKTAPDINALTNLNADVVFADDELSDDVRAQLEEAKIPVVTMMPAEDFDTLHTMYKSAGKILGGESTGKSKGESAYKLLNDSLEDMKNSVTTNTISTVAYLYTQQGEIKTFTKGSFGDTVLSYTGAVNVAQNFEGDVFDTDTFLVSNPDNIFCDSQTLETLKNDAQFKSLKALKNNHAYVMEHESFTRQGTTLVNTVYTMLQKIHPELYATPDEAKTVSNTSSNDDGSVEKEYKITITKDVKFKLEQEDDSVMALQKRLDDLGYLSVEPTGYYGELTVDAVKAFQKQNGIKETGDPDYDTLKLIFSKEAKKNPESAR